MERISKLTDEWINAVTKLNSPQDVKNLFARNATLVGTVSTTIRSKREITKYFKYFAKLPGIRVLKADYHIQQVAGKVWLNTAFIKWDWQGLEEPITARMSFLYKGDKIFQLHSSALPETNN